MDKVIPRNDPGSESMTQGQVVKQPCYMPTAENAEGNESGVSTTAGLGTTAGQSAPFAAPVYLNITASEENRAAQFKNPQVKQDVPDDARNQYQ